MHGKWFRRSLVFVVLSASNAASGQDVSTVGKLFENCHHGENAGVTHDLADMLDYALCNGYLMGLRDMLIVGGSDPQKPADRICNVPENLPVDAYEQIFVNWARDHPELWGRHRLNASLAFLQKFPCMD